MDPSIGPETTLASPMIISFIASLKDRGHGGPLGWTSPLRNDRLDHISTLDPGELGLKAIEFNGEPFVIDTQQIKDGGMQIMDAYLVADSAQPEFIGFPITDASLDATPGEPGGKSIGVVVATGRRPRLGNG
jgi:hypothetical protein